MSPCKSGQWLFEALQLQLPSFVVGILTTQIKNKGKAKRVRPGVVHVC